MNAVRLLVPQRVTKGYRDGSITQFRWPMVPQPPEGYSLFVGFLTHTTGDKKDIGLCRFENSAGDSFYVRPPVQPGQGFWLPEGWRFEPATYCYEASVSTPVYPDTYYYKADYPESPSMGWRSPVTMPFSAARTFGTAGTVRVGRLNQISNDDILREGFRCESCNICIHVGGSGCLSCLAILKPFREAWDAEHPRLPWAGNPFTWIIERGKEA
jgi:hypothetical protein